MRLYTVIVSLGESGKGGANPAVIPIPPPFGQFAIEFRKRVFRLARSDDELRAIQIGENEDRLESSSMDRAEWVDLDIECVLNLRANQTGSFPFEEACSFDRSVGQDPIRAGALKRGKRLDHHLLIVQPIIRRRGL